MNETIKKRVKEKSYTLKAHFCTSKQLQQNRSENTKPA